MKITTRLIRLFLAVLFFCLFVSGAQAQSDDDTARHYAVVRQYEYSEAEAEEYGATVGLQVEEILEVQFSTSINNRTDSVFILVSKDTDGNIDTLIDKTKFRLVADGDRIWLIPREAVTVVLSSNYSRPTVDVCTYINEKDEGLMFAVGRKSILKVVANGFGY